MHRKNRKPKYKKSWEAEAMKLLRRINGAIALAEACWRSALEWLIPMKKWVKDITQSQAPAWWRDEDCAALLPQAEERVKQFVQSIEKLSSRYPLREAEWAA